MEEVRVRTGGGEYPVNVGRGLYEDALVGELRRLRPGKVVVVSHPSIYGMHGRRLVDAIDAASGESRRISLFLFPQGEENKNLETLHEAYDSLLNDGITREDVLLAFGGGVVGDLAGFAAATYMRGIRYLQVPTTLMSMVDSSIGGKVGVDLRGAKNAVGSFYQPLAVYCDIDVLRTLPEREMSSGLAEVAKYGFLYDEALLHALEARSGERISGVRDDIGSTIVRCAGHKARAVEADERDLCGARALLNYGHTYGHALESAAGFGALRHGEAVAVGMMMAARLAELSGLAGGNLLEVHRRVLMPLLDDVYLPGGIDAEVILRHMMSDKKRGERLRFVLLEGLQAARLVESPGDYLVKKAAEEVLENMRRCG